MWKLLLSRRMLFLGMVLTVPLTASQSGQAPLADAEQQAEFVFGRWLRDPFRWMENRDHPDLYQWIRMQNDFTRDTLRGPLFDELRGEFNAIYGDETERLTLHESVDDILDRRRRTPGPSGSPASIPSPDERYKIEWTAENGTDFEVIRILDTDSNSYLPDVLIVKFADFFWDAGGESFVYVSDFDGRMGRAHPAVFRHTLGSSQMRDKLLYEAATPDTWIGLSQAGDQLVLTESRGNLTSLSAFDRNSGSRRLIRGDFANRFAPVAFSQDEVLAVSDHSTDLGELVALNLRDGSIKTVVPAADLPLAAAVRIGAEILLTYIRDAASEVRHHHLDTGMTSIVSLPGPGRASIYDEDGNFTLAWRSYTEHTSYWTFNRESRTFELSRSAPAPTLALEAERIYYRSHDGRDVPVWVVKKKGLQTGPDTPAYLYGYGGFSISILPGLNSELLPWLSRGGVYAVATLPGGLEYGEAWHRAGWRHNKLNVFRDFAAAAQALYAAGISSPAHLAISGVSNGGTLVGSTMSLYPELFKAAVPHVGVMDMTMFREHTGGKWWMEEYGDSRRRADFNFMLRYSPYHILRPGRLPHTLVMTGDMDDRVVPSHSYKFAARLQSLKGNSSKALLYTQRNASHSPYSGAPADVVEGMALKWTFLLQATSGLLD